MSLVGIGLAVTCLLGLGDHETSTRPGELLETVCARLSMIPLDDGDLRESSEHARAFFGARTLDDLHFLLGLSDEDLQGLIASGDGRKQSIALFILWNRGDTRGLLRLARTTVSSRATAVPAALKTDMGCGVPEEQDLRSYSERVLKRWLGTAPAEPGAFDRVLPGYPEFADADRWVFPWISRVRRAMTSRLDTDWQRAISDLQAVPELQRAVVAGYVALDGSPPDRAQCKEIAGFIGRDPSLILGGTDFLPEDPWLMHDYEGMLRGMIKKSFEALAQ